MLFFENVQLLQIMTCKTISEVSVIKLRIQMLFVFTPLKNEIPNNDTFYHGTIFWNVFWASHVMMFVESLN